MKLQLFSLFDSTANIYGAPFVAVNADSAVRSIITESLNPQSGPLHTHPQDFKVFALGSFDNESGQWDLAPQPVFLATVTHPASLEAVSE